MYFRYADQQINNTGSETLLFRIIWEVKLYYLELFFNIQEVKTCWLDWPMVSQGESLSTQMSTPVMSRAWSWCISSFRDACHLQKLLRVSSALCPIVNPV